jgi:hypothetical protein
MTTLLRRLIHWPCPWCDGQHKEVWNEYRGKRWVIWCENSHRRGWFSPLVWCYQRVLVWRFERNLRQAGRVLDEDELPF